MVKFPEDFWYSLKEGDTSDWLFWVDIGIIIGVLFLLLCFVRCCMWCFDSKKNDEKYDPNIQDMKPAPDWLQHQNHSQNARMPPHYGPSQGGSMAVHDPYDAPSAWGRPSAARQPQYNANPAYSHNAAAPAAPPFHQHLSGAPLHDHQLPHHNQGHNHSHSHPSQHSPNWSAQYAVHPVPAPAAPRMQQQAVRWTKEDFESVFSDKASVDMVQGTSSPAADRQEGRPLLARSASNTSSKPLPGTQQHSRGNSRGSGAPAHSSHAQASPFRSDSPSRRDSPARRDSPSHQHASHTPPLPHDRAPAGRNSQPPGGGFHVSVDDMHRTHSSSTPEQHDAQRHRFGSTPPTDRHTPSMHSTPASGTPPGAIPSKMYLSSTPSPSDAAPSDTEAGAPGRAGMQGRNGSFSSGARERRTGVPKLQPPLPVSPRVGTALDTAMAANHTAGSETPPILPDVGTGMDTSKSPPVMGRTADAAAGQRGAGAPPALSQQQEHPGRALRMRREAALGGPKHSSKDAGDIHGDLPRAVNPSAYAAMYEHNLRSRKSGGLSASQSQGFHLEAELMLVGGGAGDSGGSLLEGRDLANLALDTQTVAAVECPEDCTLTEFLGLTRQRHVQAQFVEKNTDHSDRALAVWDLGVRLFKLRRRDEAQFAVMRRLHRLPSSPGARFWKQAIDIDFEADSFHPALGHRMTVAGAEEVIFVEIANQSGMWLELRLPPQPPPGVMHERWVKLLLQEGGVVCLPRGCSYILGMPENGMVGLLRARMAAPAAA